MLLRNRVRVLELCIKFVFFLLFQGFGGLRWGVTDRGRRN